MRRKYLMKVFVVDGRSLPLGFLEARERYGAGSMRQLPFTVPTHTNA